MYPVLVSFKPIISLHKFVSIHADKGDPVNITVGAFGGGSGQFVMVIEGLAISPSTELDGFVLRVPSSVADEPLGVYMVSRFTSLDLYLTSWSRRWVDPSL